MPYIKPQSRRPIDELLKPLTEYLSAVPLEKQDGAVNYTVTKILKAVYNNDNYFTFNRSLGLIGALQQEWYRREVVPYEDRKIKENGDV